MPTDFFLTRESCKFSSGLADAIGCVCVFPLVPHDRSRTWRSYFVGDSEWWTCDTGSLALPRFLKLSDCRAVVRGVACDESIVTCPWLTTSLADENSQALNRSPTWKP